MIDGQALALLSKQLVTIDTDAPITCTIAELAYSGIDQEKTKQLFLELDFNRLLQDQSLFSESATESQDIRIDQSKRDSPMDKSAYWPITNKEMFDKVLNELRGAMKIAIDTETDGLDSTTANLVGIAISWGQNKACYIPIAHSRSIVPAQLDLATVRLGLNEILSNREKVFVAQNAKFDHKILVRHDFIDFKIGGDPMLASYLLHQDQERHNLDDLSEKYLGHKPITFEEVCGPKKSRISFADVPLPLATNYAAEDADVALRLETLLIKDVYHHMLDKLYFGMELPLEEVLGRMELTGVKVDAEVLAAVGRELKTRLLDLESQAYQMAGIGFNLGSPKQTAKILFETLALPVVKKTKMGYSTDSSVLERLASFHPIAGVLLEHRTCAKLINTYIETLPALINRNTGRLHTNYNQFVTATGRLSSSDPNLQNIPARTKEGRRIRQAFVAKPGCRLISLDYSQVELRLLAYVSNDPVLQDSFAKDEDVHRRTAAEIFDVDTIHVTKEQRDAAKTINFGLLYGMGAQFAYHKRSLFRARMRKPILISILPSTQAFCDGKTKLLPKHAKTVKCGRFSEESDHYLNSRRETRWKRPVANEWP